VEIARPYLGNGLLAINKLPWLGHFSLRQQLLMKKTIADKLSHDWILHVDADEWLCAPDATLTLSEGIMRAHQEGFTCINFEEMVFVPWPGENFVGREYTREMTTYYFFKPSEVRLMRAWRRDIDADNVSFGGHRLVSNDLKIYPRNFINRHYIMLSQEHGRHKYASRRFDEAELAMGWHSNRISLDDGRLALRPSAYLQRLDRWDSADFVRSAPAMTHFWEWQNGRSVAAVPPTPQGKAFALPT
jgi:hypothetical protein